MKKTVLSEIDIYQGDLKMPKNFDIDRSKLKADILDSHLQANTITNNQFSFSFLDYKVPSSKALDMVQTYIVDYLDSYFNTRVFPFQRFGNILKPNEQTFSRNFLDLNNSSNSIDYVLVYGVDVANNSCSIVIEYDNKKYLKQKHFIPMSNNYFVVLPGSERFFISSNISKQTNTFLTCTFQCN